MMIQDTTIRQQRWTIFVLLAVATIQVTTAFSPSPKFVLGRRQTLQRLGLGIDPSNIIPLLSVPNDIIQTTQSLQVTLNQLALLTTTTNVAAMLKPAAGHTQPFWGPPDPYLTAGKSIPPSTKGLENVGVIPPAITDLPEPVQLTMKAGYKVLDASTIQQESVLPGFTPVSGILPFHNPMVPPETPATFAAQVEWSAKFINVIDKLPEAAFVYALIEFFILRPGLDLYKEDIELQQQAEGSVGSLTYETLAVTAIRIGVFFIIAVFTNLIFG
jgi:hypothetical protein